MSRASKIMLAVTILVVGALIGLFFLFGSDNNSPSQVNSQSELVRAASHRLDSGAVQVVEFGDYECPACSVAYPITQKLLADYKGKISFYFRNFPLSQIHPNAMISAEAAEAAAAQGKFWQMHDLLYSQQTEWANLGDPLPKLKEYARNLGLNVDQFESDLRANKYQTAILQDLNDGVSLGVPGTPTFFVNGSQSDSYGFDSLKSLIEAAISQ